MAKFYGTVGFVKAVETSPGVYEEQSEERNYYGDLLRHSRGWATADKLNDDITLNNEISILSDSYITKNLNTIKYVDFMGTRWKVMNIEVEYPRIVLTIGGVYNG
jgi:hypothetical protein